MKNDVYNGIMGLVVGDAVGVPYEFKQRDTFHAEGMTGFGTYNQPPGTWSDDSSMTLATMFSITNKKGIDLNNIMNEFQNWMYQGTHTPWGERFDIGSTTAIAIDKYTSGKYNVKNCGCGTVNANGNGALMRILPLAFMDCSNTYVSLIASLTHSHYISTFACHLYIEIAKELIVGKDLETSIDDVIKMRIVSEPDNTSPKEFDRLKNLKDLARNEIKSSGYVVHTLEAALWCLWHTDSYSNCILTAVNLGGDTDTIAAVAGGLAGIAYGVGSEKGIPQRWIDTIARKDWVEQLCNDFTEVITHLQYLI